jgi:hypothetical protein
VSVFGWRFDLAEEARLRGMRGDPRVTCGHPATRFTAAAASNRNVPRMRPPSVLSAQHARRVRACTAASTGARRGETQPRVPTICSNCQAVRTRIPAPWSTPRSVRVRRAGRVAARAPGVCLRALAVAWRSSSRRRRCVAATRARLGYYQRQLRAGSERTCSAQDQRREEQRINGLKNVEPYTPSF